MNTTFDFTDIAALFNVATAAPAQPTTSAEVRELSAIEVAGIGGGEGISLWG